MEAINPVNTPLDSVLNCLTSVKGPNTAGFYQVHCPAHNDGNRSLSFKASYKDGVSFTCFAGCQREAILSSLNLTEEQMHTNGSPDPVPRSSLTIIDLAVDKFIRPEMLLTWGLEDINHKGVKIPYYTMDGHPYERYRLRTNVKAKDGSTWNSESKAAITPYGLHKLSEARSAKRLIIVEGESDCWTLWAHKYPALGLPGAKMIGSLQSEHIEGLEAIYVMQEPDKAGQAFPTEVKKRLDKLGYKGKVYAVHLMEACQAKDPNELHKKDMKGFRVMFEKALLHALPLHKQRMKVNYYRMCDLLDKVLPDTKWAIPDILPEGLTLLVGKPKLGKSFMLLSFMHGIASGGTVLGSVPVEQGETLYIALEDQEKRLQKRTKTLLQHCQTSPNFICTNMFPRLDEGGLEELEEFIQSHPRLRLIGIDTWAKFKPLAKGYNRNQYDEDYSAIAPLQELALKYEVAIILVHHFKKENCEDPLDMISGSTGISGAADGVLLLHRKRGETDARLYVDGKDIEEPQEYQLSFMPECVTWVIKGETDDNIVAGTPQQQEILDELKQHKDGLGVKPLADKLGKNVNTTRNLLVKLRNEGKVLLQNNVYSVVTHSNRSKLDDSVVTHSNRSELTNNLGETTTEVTTPYYDEPSSVVTSMHPSNGLVQPAHNVRMPQLTTVTTLTMEVIEARLPEWLRVGTFAWNKQVERVGLPEMMQRRRAAIEQMKER